MANFTVSPGVSLNEIDQTFLTAEPIQAGAAIIGPTVKGPIETPVKVTSYTEYTTMFGDVIESGSQNYSYLTSIAAYSYFNSGGESLLVTRVVTGSFTSATTNVNSAVESGVISIPNDSKIDKCKFVNIEYFKLSKCYIDILEIAEETFTTHHLSFDLILSMEQIRSKFRKRYRSSINQGFNKDFCKSAML